MRTVLISNNKQIIWFTLAEEENEWQIRNDRKGNKIIKNKK